ncbi:FAD-binding oxidoreductase [Lacisediminimonas profundi]|uniref:FAD-binding oxidoreductase n=1 Tax=Lacisediminimonas profundi TaxID=2603856 RepID=UPI001F4F3BBB|nr:FAD-binding oxidoreductase [Lacisediminimonas profundi]
MPSAALESLAASFSGRLLTAPADTAPFLTDWIKRWSGCALAVAQPDTTEDVAAIVRWCAANRVPIVPQGGNTGMVGGGIPGEDGRSLVLSTQRLRRVRAVDPLNNTLTVEAGVTLLEVQQAAREAGRLFPLSLGAEGTCNIGGNLSTNAGGVQVLRYGNARELCLGLEVVTADGQVWNGLRGLRKDNTGYDLRDLFIGAEGTLGIITAATLKMYPQPAARMTAIATVDSPHAALRLLELAQQRLSSSLTAFELMNDFCIESVARHFPASRRPLATPSPWHVLLESSDPISEEHARDSFDRLMEEAMEKELISDAAVATSLAQSEAFWTIRHHLAEAQGREGDSIKHDVSVPISAIGDFVVQTNAALEHASPGIRMVVFGHLGDGNLHYNVTAPVGGSGPAFRAQQGLFNDIVYEAVTRANGSISAEHGIGQLKRDKLSRYKSEVELKLMARLKAAFDPDNLMNPGRLLP